MGRLQFRRWFLSIFGLVLAVLAASSVNTHLATALTGTGGMSDQSNAPALNAARSDVWPKKVDAFLAGEYLQKADVMLEQRWSGDVAAWVIRWATNSQFSHAALVYTAPPYDSGISNTFVIEAGTKGVDLTKLTDYVHDSRVNFIAIKRLKPQPWFDTNRRSRVRGLLLTEPHSIAEQRTITDGRIIPGV